MFKSLFRSKPPRPVVSKNDQNSADGDDLCGAQGGNDEGIPKQEETESTKSEFKIDEHFHVCHVSSCENEMPCQIHQQGLLSERPEFFFMSIIQNSVDGPAKVSNLLRWAYWTLKSGTSEEKWEAAISLQAQALAVHYQEPRVKDEEYSEGTETYEAEYWQREPHLQADFTAKEKAKYDKEMASILAKRKERAQARQERAVKRTQQKAALSSIWRQIFSLTSEFLAFEHANGDSLGNWELFMNEWIDLRRRLAESPARRGLYRQNTERKWVFLKAEISHYYISTLKKLMEKCLRYANVPETDVGFMLLGSLAKAEGMPFSDVEFGVILGDQAVEKDVWKAIRIFRFFVILFGETPFGVLQAQQPYTFPTEDKKAWSFTPLGFHVDNGVNVIVNKSDTIVALQAGGASDVVTRTALRQVAFLCGNASLVQHYQSTLYDFWSSQPLLRRKTAKDLLVAALQKFQPQNIGDVCSLKLIYRMLALSLEALSMWYDLHAVGCMNTIALLRSKGVMSWDTAARVGTFLEILMGLRMEAQIRSQSQNDDITKISTDAGFPFIAQLLEMASEFHAGGVKYVQKLAEAPPLPTTMLQTLAMKPVMFTLEAPQLVQKVVTIRTAVPAKREDTNKVATTSTTTSGTSSLSKLIMIKDYLPAFISLLGRMALGSSCKSLRIVSPGPVTSIQINSTVEAQMFLDGPPTLGCHILLLGGYSALSRPYSKRHAIPKSSMDSWQAEDQRRKEEMNFERATLQTLMNIRPHHRVVGLHFGVGQRDVSQTDYCEFWTLVSPSIGWLCISDEKKLDRYREMFEAKPYRGSYFKITSSGNCWPFLIEMVNKNPALEGLSIAWPATNGSYYCGPKYSVPTWETFQANTTPLDGLRYLHVGVPSREDLQPNNAEIVAKWLIERAPHLRKVSVLSGDLIGVTDALKKSCRLQELHMTCSDDATLSSLLNGLVCESFIHSGNPPNPGNPAYWKFTNLDLKHLNLGSMWGLKYAGLVTILKAFPRLHSFAASQLTDLTPSQAPRIQALLPHAHTIRIFQGSTPFLVQQAL